MTMALAVVMIACEAAAGKPGDPGQPGAPGEPGEPGGVPPSVEEPISDLGLLTTGTMATHTIDLDKHFSIRTARTARL